MRSTRILLTCAAIGAVAGLLVIMLSPLTAVLALASPPIYAAVASIHMLGPFTAAAWFRRPGAASLTALIAGLVAIPFTALGPLLVFAIAAPAVLFDLVLAIDRHRRHPHITWYAAALAAAGAIIAISLPVIDPGLLSGGLVALVVGARLAAYLLVAWLSRELAVRLTAAGVRPPAR